MSELAATNSALPDMRPAQATVTALVQRILDEAKGQGASAAEVVASDDVGLGVSVRMGELENVEFTQDRGFGITVYLGQRKGSASTSDSRPEAVADTVAKALDIARFTQDDPCSGLADKDLMPKELPDLDLYHPWDLDIDEAKDMALACEAAGLASDDKITNSDGAQVSSARLCRVYGNSHGFIGGYLGTRHGASCMFIASDESGMQRDHWYTVNRNAQLLEDMASVGQEAARRALRRLQPRTASTGQVPVVFSPQMAGGLVGHIISALSGSAIYRKSSFLADKLGEQVVADHVCLVEEPLLPGQLGSAAFDGDGVATWSKAFIDAGIASNYLLSTYSARRLGMQTTGNAGGVHNLTLTGRTLPVPELLGDIKQGLYVTELMGQGVNTVTGDYSRGAAGFWIENGELAYPVDGITIAGRLQDMLMQIEALGDDVDVRGNVRAPSLRIGQMMVAGS